MLASPARRDSGCARRWPPASVLAAVSIWGGLRVGDATLTRDGTPLAIGLVQANIRQEEKWDPGMAAEIERRYDRLTRQAAAAGAAAVLWPESATPYYFNEVPARAAAVRSLVREIGMPLLFGTDEIERGSPDRYYNSAFMLAPDGAGGGRLPQDPAGAVRRVRAAAVAAVLRLATGRRGVGLLARRPK